MKGYNEDVEKYAPTQLQTYVFRHILRTGWNKAGQTIKLGNFGESTYNSKEVREAFNILEKAFILHLVYPVTAMHAPALPALKRAPKLMWLDTGLVNFAANIQTEVLHDRTLMDTWQGAIAEHIVAQQLQVLLDEQYISDLHFWVRDKQGSNAETDFVWQKGTQIIPVEVKAEENLQSKSLRSFVEKNPGLHGIRFSMSDYRQQEWLTNYPLYSVGYIF